VVLGINLWQSQSIVVDYQNRYPSILMLKDSGSVWNNYRINGYIPLNYLLDHDLDQTVDYRMEGYSHSTFTSRILSLMSDVSVALTPSSSTYQRGGKLTYDVTFQNWATASRMFYVLMEADLPNGNTARLGSPSKVTLNASQILTVPKSHNIPTTVPLGFYTYRMQIGLPPADLWFQETFEFEIVP
jgi:hypothetical protein